MNRLQRIVALADGAGAVGPVRGPARISGAGAGAGAAEGDGARPVELAVVVQSDVRPWRYPPVCDFLYGEWLRADYEAGGVPPGRGRCPTWHR